VSDFDEISEQELERLTADLPVPTLAEAEKMLLEAIDHRIEACNRLKEQVQFARGPVSKERVREWRKHAKTDGLSEKHLRTCRDLYGDVLEGTMSPV
jgi:hypothetical protein